MPDSSHPPAPAQPGTPAPAPLRPEHVPPRPLDQLAAGIEGADLVVAAGHDTPSVTGITHDSRSVLRGDLYVARAGERTHGIAYVRQVLAAGAAAVLTDPAARDTALAAGVPAVLVVPDPRAVMGAAAAWVYGYPADELVLLGVTGTNGKTTTAYLLESGLRAAGHRTGLVGTVETRIGDDVVKSVRTTPEATDLHALFAVMRERGVTAVAMEVSSHALALGRVAGTHFDVAAFTNLSQDHLDFHTDMDDYFAAKARLFTSTYSSRGVVCVDDEWGSRLAAQSPIQVVTAATTGARATWHAVDVAEEPDTTMFLARALDGSTLRVRTRLVGRFNVANALVALVALRLAGVSAQAALDGLAALRGVPGRLERVDAGQPFLAVVDYAHKPDAVTAALQALRPQATGRLVIVLGAGGDRDPGKRPLMGEIAARRRCRHHYGR